MAGEVYPLAIWPHTVTPEQLEMVKRAKLEVAPPFSIAPSPAVPGSPTRVLCFGSWPPFICDPVTIAAENVDRYESVLGAMREWLAAPEGREDSGSHADWLSAVMGVKVVQICEEVWDE